MYDCNLSTGNAVGTMRKYRVIRNDCRGFNNLSVWNKLGMLWAQCANTGLFEMIVGVLTTCQFGTNWECCGHNAQIQGYSK